MARAVYLGVHLLNTFLLVAALALATEPLPAGRLAAADLGAAVALQR